MLEKAVRTTLASASSAIEAIRDQAISSSSGSSVLGISSFPAQFNSQQSEFIHPRPPAATDYGGRFPFLDDRGAGNGGSHIERVAIIHTMLRELGCLGTIGHSRALQDIPAVRLSRAKRAFGIGASRDQAQVDDLELVLGEGATKEVLISFFKRRRSAALPIHSTPSLGT